jgi:hypothetical protein
MPRLIIADFLGILKELDRDEVPEVGDEVVIEIGGAKTTAKVIERHVKSEGVNPTFRLKVDPDARIRIFICPTFMLK